MIHNQRYPHHHRPPHRPPHHVHGRGGFLLPFLAGLAITAPFWFGGHQSQIIPAPFPYYYPLPIPYGSPQFPPQAPFPPAFPPAYPPTIPPAFPF